MGLKTLRRPYDSDKKLNKRSEQLKCGCKIPEFNRTVDSDFNCICGKCGKTL